MEQQIQLYENEEQKDLSIPFRGSRNQRILKRGIDF